MYLKQILGQQLHPIAKDIARHAGMSPATVPLVLRRVGSRSDGTGCAVINRHFWLPL
jgi:hypothetical protein